MKNFWTTDIPKAVSILKSDFSAEVDFIINLAGEICENKFTFRSHWEMEKTNIPVIFEKGVIIYDKTQNGDMEWVYAFNRLSYLVVLAKAWAITKEEKFYNNYKRLITDWLRKVPFTEESKKTTWRSIETGIRCENIIRTIVLFADIMEENLLFEIEESLKVHAAWLTEAHTGFQKLSNWGVLQDHGLFLLGAYFGNDNWCDTAASRLETELFHQVLGDGVHWEQSPMYHCEVLHCCLDTILAASEISYGLSEDFTAKVHDMARALSYLIRPDGKLICQSDSDEVDARDLLSLAALVFSDGELKAYAGGGLYPENIWDFSDRVSEYEEIREGITRGSVALSDSGNYMLWNGNGGFLHFHCGALGSGHGHADLLHFDFVKNGESVIIDSGRYTYKESEIRKRLKRPAAHNTIVVDGRDCSVYRSCWDFGPIAEPIKGEFKFTKDVDYISGGHLGYLSCGVIPRRRILRLGDRFWLISDFFYTANDNEHIYDRYFHFAEGEVCLGDGRVVYEEQKVSLYFPDEGTKLQKSVSPYSIEYNELKEGLCIKASNVAEGSVGFFAVLADTAKEVKITKHEVFLSESKRALKPHEAQAIKIQEGDETWLIIICHNEVISEVNLLTAESREAYGKVTVFSNKTNKGICLAW